MSAQGRTICIVDDDEAVRDSLCSLLAVAGHVPCAFASAAEFLEGCADVDIGCVLLDVRLPDADGIDLLERLLAMGALREPPVIVITGHGDVPMAVKAMKIGAADFIEKPFDADALLKSVEQALASRDRAERASAFAERAREAFGTLTPREGDVMKQLIIGRPNKIIAHNLGLSPRTVEVHRARIMKKTGAQSLSHLVRMAISAGIDPQV